MGWPACCSTWVINNQRNYNQLLRSILFGLVFGEHDVEFSIFSTKKVFQYNIGHILEEERGD